MATNKRIFIQLADVAGCSFYRAYLPGMHCYEQLKKEGIELVVSGELNMKDHYDAYVFQRVVTEKFFDRLPELHKKSKIVWNVDDDLLSIPPYSPARFGSAELYRYTQCLEMADHIITTTPTLAAELGHEDKVLIGPNLIDLNQLKRKQKKTKTTTVVWAGSESHTGDIHSLVGTCCRLDEYRGKVKVKFFGLSPNPLMQELDSFEYIPSVPFMDFYPTLMRLQGDIGLAPLSYNRFNSCRSELKWLEYSAAGMATVCQDFKPYNPVTHGWNGVKVYENEWEDMVCYLIDNPKERRMMAENAYETVKENHSWQSDKCKDVWLNIWRTLVA